MAGLEEGYSPLAKIFRSATGERALRSSGGLQHTDKVGILPSEEIIHTIRFVSVISTNNIPSGNTPFCDSKSHRGALESTSEEGYG